MMHGTYNVKLKIKMDLQEVGWGLIWLRTGNGAGLF
jgi:hypothetical protein